MITEGILVKGVGGNYEIMTKQGRVVCKARGRFRKDQLVPEEYTTYFSSVIVFGRARVLSDDSQKRRTLRLLADKYVGDPLEKVDAEIDRFYDTVIMVEISVEHMTGKQAIELVR